RIGPQFLTVFCDPTHQGDGWMSQKRHDPSTENNWITSCLLTNRELSRGHGYPVKRQVFWVQHAPARAFSSREFRSARVALTIKPESHSATAKPLAHYSLSRYSPGTSSCGTSCV